MSKENPYRIELKTVFSLNWQRLVDRQGNELTFPTYAQAMKHLRAMEKNNEMPWIDCPWRVIKICWEGRSNDNF